MQKEIKKDIRDYIGSTIDYGLLAVPHILKPFKPKPDIAEDTYQKQVDYYFENGYADDPRTLFRLPDAVPDYRKISEVPYHDGYCQIHTYDSAFEPVNPLIKNHYHSFENNRTGYLVRWTHGKENQRTLVCLHGYMLGEPNQAEKMFNVAKLFQSGMDVALFVSPFHWRRAPEGKAQRGMFIQPDNVERPGISSSRIWDFCKLIQAAGFSKSPGHDARTFFSSSGASLALYRVLAVHNCLIILRQIPSGAHHRHSQWLFPCLFHSLWYRNGSAGVPQYRP